MTHHAEEEDINEPTEGDYVISDGPGRLGSGYRVSIHEGRYVGSVGTRDEAERMIRLHAGPNYRPDVWILSDHGNYHRAEGFDWSADQ